MKPHISTLLLLCIGALIAAILPCHAQPKTYEEPTGITWEGKSGNWKDAKNWKGGKVPSGFEKALCRVNYTVTVNSPVPELYAAAFAGSKEGGKLVITDGAKLKLKNSLTLYFNQTGSFGAAEMTGGELEIGGNGEYGILGLGTSITFSTRAVMTVSGGVIRGGVLVGSPAISKGSALFVVKGSKAKIEDNDQKATLTIDGTGEVDFVLDEAGVTCLSYAKKTVHFKPGSKLRVDASGYTGKAKRIPLILAARWNGDADLDMSVLAQPRAGTATLKLEKPPAKQTGIYLEIKP